MAQVHEPDNVINHTWVSQKSYVAERAGRINPVSRCGFNRMLKKPIPGLFQPGNGKRGLPFPHIFNDLWLLKMAVFPCTAHRLSRGADDGGREVDQCDSGPGCTHVERARHQGAVSATENQHCLPLRYCLMGQSYSSLSCSSFNNSMVLPARVRPSLKISTT